MLNTFKELLDNGIAPSPYEIDTQAATPTLDRFVRHYNNYWGLATGTHCSTPDNGETYIITGSLVSDRQRFSNMLWTNHWQAVMFPSSWNEVMRNNLMKGDFQTINGDTCYVISRMTPEEYAQEGGVCIGSEVVGQACNPDVVLN